MQLRVRHTSSTCFPSWLSPSWPNVGIYPEKRRLYTKWFKKNIGVAWRCSFSGRWTYYPFLNNRPKEVLNLRDARFRRGWAFFIHCDLVFNTEMFSRLMGVWEHSVYLVCSNVPSWLELYSDLVIRAPSTLKYCDLATRNICMDYINKLMFNMLKPEELWRTFVLCISGL